MSDICAKASDSGELLVHFYSTIKLYKIAGYATFEQTRKKVKTEHCLS